MSLVLSLKKKRFWVRQLETGFCDRFVEGGQIGRNLVYDLLMGREKRKTLPWGRGSKQGVYFLFP